MPSTGDDTGRLRALLAEETALRRAAETRSTQESEAHAKVLARLKEALQSQGSWRERAEKAEQELASLRKRFQELSGTVESEHANRQREAEARERTLRSRANEAHDSMRQTEKALAGSKSRVSELERMMARLRVRHDNEVTEFRKENAALRSKISSLEQLCDSAGVKRQPASSISRAEGLPPLGGQATAVPMNRDSHRMSVASTARATSSAGNGGTVAGTGAAVGNGQEQELLSTIRNMLDNNLQQTRELVAGATVNASLIGSRPPSVAGTAAPSPYASRGAHLESAEGTFAATAHGYGQPAHAGAGPLPALVHRQADIAAPASSGNMGQFVPYPEHHRNVDAVQLDHGYSDATFGGQARSSGHSHVEQHTNIGAEQPLDTDRLMAQQMHALRSAVRQAEEQALQSQPSRFKPPSYQDSFKHDFGTGR